MEINSLSFIKSSDKNYQSFYQFLSVMLISLTVISCVTINIYFPAAAAEKVAEQIVNDVLQSDVPDATKDKKTSEMQNNQSQINPGPLHQKQYYASQAYASELLLAIVDFVVPVAEAGQADISINSSKINSIRKSMEKRQSKLRPFYSSGAVGFTNNGLIASVSNAGLSVKQKSTVKKLIRSENNDRMALYSEIANANGHPEWQADIQKTFSKTWINKISSGWMYQSTSGQWKRK